MIRAAATICIISAILAISVAKAQDHGDSNKHGQSPGASPPVASPYAGMERRTVKALSDQLIADLKTGRGMSLALAAELNGYPGPSHVLELAGALQLSDEQRRATKALFEAMKAETVSIGERILVEEAALDRLFAARHATQATVEVAVARIAAEQGKLRSAHLRYHLAMMDVLSPSQVDRYAQLRGYNK